MNISKLNFNKKLQPSSNKVPESPKLSFFNAALSGFAIFLIFCSLVNAFTHFPYFAWAWILLQLFILWLAADFVTGVVHWWEDAYGNPKWPIVGKHVVVPNLIHHKHPNKLLEGSYWQRINTSCYGAALASVIFWFLGWQSWQMFVFLLFCTQSNEVHAISHRSDKKNNKFIKFLQKSGILQSQKTHRWHHKAPYDTNFCVMSEFVNPILEKINFWMKLETFILKVFKIDVLRGSSVRDGL